MSFLPSGVATLMSDLGTTDPSVGILKGVMLSRFAQLKIIDLTHYVPPRDVVWASYALAGSFQNFPPGSVHCAIVKAGFGTERDVLVAEKGGHGFVAPDNGLLTQLLTTGGQVWRVDLKRVPVAPLRRSFHTRDVIAPLGALLASGKLRSEDCGDAVDDPKLIETTPVIVTPEGAEGVVVGEDRFGNLFTSLCEDDVPPDAESLVVAVAGTTMRIVNAYSLVEPGEPLARFNSFGLLEVAIRDGKASETFEWERGTRVEVRH